MERFLWLFDMEQNFKRNIIGISQGPNVDFRQNKNHTSDLDARVQKVYRVHIKRSTLSATLFPTNHVELFRKIETKRFNLGTFEMNSYPNNTNNHASLIIFFIVGIFVQQSFFIQRFCSIPDGTHL